VREELAAIEGQLLSLTYSTYRATSHDVHERDIGMFQTMPKLYMTDLAGRMAKLARDIVENAFVDMGGDRLKWIERFMISLSMSIAGGTSNIQRNIIARAQPWTAARQDPGSRGMNFLLSEEQLALVDSVAGLLRDRCDALHVHKVFNAPGDAAFDADLWRALCEMGVPAIMIAEEHGGLGLGLVDLAIVAEALGHAVAPVPFFGHVMAALAIALGGSEAQKAHWLPEASGRRSARYLGFVRRHGRLAARAVDAVRLEPDGNEDDGAQRGRGRSHRGWHCGWARCWLRRARAIRPHASTVPTARVRSIP